MSDEDRLAVRQALYHEIQELIDGHKAGDAVNALACSLTTVLIQVNGSLVGALAAAHGLGDSIARGVKRHWETDRAHYVEQRRRTLS